NPRCKISQQREKCGLTFTQRHHSRPGPRAHASIKRPSSYAYLPCPDQPILEAPAESLVRPRFDGARAATALLRACGSLDGNLRGKCDCLKKIQIDSMACSGVAITSACYLCNTSRKTRFIGPFRSVLLL